MVITLYKLDPSPPVRTVLMTIDLLGLNIETKNVNILAKEQYTPEYLEKDPLHQIPLLEEDGMVIADSHAIITYLVSKYGGEKQATLYPTDLKARAIIDQRLYFNATILFPKVLDMVVSITSEGAPGPSAKQIAAVNEAYGFTEKYLGKSLFMAGDHLTLADIACVAIVSSLDVFVPLSEEFPKVREWWKKLQAQEWYERANEPGLKMFAGRMNQTIKKNSNAE